MSPKSTFPVYIRTIAFVMLVAVFHYVAGYRLMYSLGILFAKQEAKECMIEKKNQVSKLTLTASEFKSLTWTEDNKEFSFNNEMYDVTGIQKSGDNYIITIYMDDKETQWTSSYNDFEKQVYSTDQPSKSNKSAEEIMSAFQKEFTPVSAFKINSFASTNLRLNTIANGQYSLSLPDNIFHPPSIS
jgi:hypothetical protein